VSGLGARLLVTARRPERAAALARELGGEGVAGVDLPGCEYDALVHCTPAGSLSQPGLLPFDERALREGCVVVESVYRPRRTPLLELAERRGCTIVDGAAWFVLQAAEQVRLFTGREAPALELRAAFDAALEVLDG